MLSVKVPLFFYTEFEAEKYINSEIRNYEAIRKKKELNTERLLREKAHALKNPPRIYP